MNKIFKNLLAINRSSYCLENINSKSNNCFDLVKSKLISNKSNQFNYLRCNKSHTVSKLFIHTYTLKYIALLHALNKIKQIQI